MGQIGCTRRVVGRLLDLLHISWRTSVADQLSDHMRATRARTRARTWGIPAAILDQSREIHRYKAHATQTPTRTRRAR